MSSSNNSSSNNQSALLAASAAVAGAVAGVVASQLYAARSSAKAAAAHAEYHPPVPCPEQHPTVIYNEEAPVVASRNSFIFPHNHEERMRRQIAARQVVEEENAMARDSVTVRVPATSANMGPGCKCSFMMTYRK